MTDALGRVTDNNYDPLGRLSRTLQDVAGIQAETRFEYDALDNLTRVTDPKGLDTRYKYNGFGDLTRLTSPDTGVTTYTYDSAGNRISSTDARGKLTVYAYDALNRLTGIGYDDARLDVSYIHDVVQPVCTAGETFAIGRMTRMYDGSGTTQYCFDHRGNIVRKVQTTNGRTFTVRYSYTLADRLASVTYPSGVRVDYAHNALGLPAAITVTQAGGGAETLLAGVTYYPFGPPAVLEYGDGRQLKRSLNQNYQPGFIEDTQPGGLSLGYQFDEVGNLVTLRRGDQSGPPLRDYSYDALNRLTSARDGTTDVLLQAYSYDATGNRISATKGGVSKAYTYPNESHRLSSAGGIARSYDAAGNTLAAGTKRYEYNAAGRLSRSMDGFMVFPNYHYNGKGEQVWVDPGGYSMGHTYTIYDEAGQWLGEYDDFSNSYREVIWLDRLPVGVYAEGKLHYIQPDHLGTPRVVMDPVRQSAVWTWGLESEAFGDTPPNQDSDGDGVDFRFDMRFPGQRYDQWSGLNYNYFRNYDANAGRYVESDPIGLEGGINSYAYVRGAPLRLYDRLGLAPSCNCAEKRPAFGVWVSFESGGAAWGVLGGGYAATGGVTNAVTGETCLYSIRCLYVGLGLGVSLGAQGGVSFGKSLCGKSLEGSALAATAEFTVPAGGGSAGVSYGGSGGVTAGVGPAFGVNVNVGAGGCNIKIFECKNTPCYC